MSQFNFSRANEEFIFSGEAILSITIATPKNIERQKPVVCTLDSSMGSEEDKFQLHVISRSVFELTGTADLDTLQEDAKTSCCPIAIDVLTQKVAELTHIHIGRSLTIPIPRDL